LIFISFFIGCNAASGNSRDAKLFFVMLAICVSLVLVGLFIYVINQRRSQGGTICPSRRIFNDEIESAEIAFPKRHVCRTKKTSEGYDLEFLQLEEVIISSTSTAVIGVEGSLFFFEVMVAKKNLAETRVFIGVTGSRDFSYAHFPGWGKDSLGFDSSTGKIFSGDMQQGVPYSAGYDVGDTIGCAFDGSKVFFTKNSIQLPDALSSSHMNGFFLKKRVYITVATDGPVKLRVKLNPPFHFPGAAKLLMPAGRPMIPLTAMISAIITSKASDGECLDEDVLPLANTMAGSIAPTPSNPKTERPSSGGQNADMMFRNSSQEQKTRELNIQERAKNPRSAEAI